MTESDVLRRVRALLDKAESTEFEPEREACIAKAQALMVQHAIDEALVRQRDRVTTAKPIAKTITYTESKGYSGVKANLLHRLSQRNRCKAVFYTGRRGGPQRAEIVGFPDDIAYVEMLYTSLLLQMFADADRAYVTAEPEVPTDEWGWELDEPSRKPHRKVFVNSFAEAFVAEVSERLWLANKKAEAESEANAPAGQSTAIALRDRNNEVDAYYERLHPDVRKQRRAPSNNWSGQGDRAGRDAGQRADLTGGNRGVGSRGALPGRQTA